MVAHSQFPMYYVDLEMDDNIDGIKIDLVGPPTLNHPQISIILDDTCDDCSLKTNLIATYFKRDQIMLNLTRWTEYYDNDPSEILDHFITFWNISDNTITVSNQGEEILLSEFFNKQPCFNY